MENPETKPSSRFKGDDEDCDKDHSVTLSKNTTERCDTCNHNITVNKMLSPSGPQWESFSIWEILKHTRPHQTVAFLSAFYCGIKREVQSVLDIWRPFL